jgi:lipoprotein signal peptidase
LTLILSGAIGNLIDRIANGFVVDFIDFHYQSFYWPIFNFADKSHKPAICSFGQVRSKLMPIKNKI